MDSFDYFMGMLVCINLCLCQFTAQVLNLGLNDEMKVGSRRQIELVQLVWIPTSPIRKGSFNIVTSKLPKTRSNFPRLELSIRRLNYS